MKIVESILTKNRCYKTNRKITVKGLMLHSVGCPQPKASVFVSRWNSDTYDKCVHGFIDGNDGTVYQTLPWNHRGWHAGGSANGTHIGVEMCEPSCIKYTSGAKFTCSNEEKAKACVEITYRSAVELFAFLCKEFNLNPLADGVIVSHKEGHSRGWASNHGDCDHLWSQLKTGHTMDGFRKDVYAAMNGTSEPIEIVEPTEPVKPPATPKKVASAKSRDTSLKGSYRVEAEGGLNLRYVPGNLSDDNVVSTIPNDSVVRNYGFYTDVGETQWLYVAYRDMTGFVNSSYLRKL